VRRAGSRTVCRPRAVWLINELPACRVSSVAWLKRGPFADVVLQSDMPAAVVSVVSMRRWTRWLS